MLIKNIDCWGPQATDFVSKAAHYDAIGLVELHTPPSESLDVLGELQYSGFQSAISPAREVGNIAKSGGAVIPIQEFCPYSGLPSPVILP